MKIGFLKLNEAGTEDVTTIEGNEQPAEVSTNPDDPNFDYDAWLAEDDNPLDEDEETDHDSELNESAFNDDEDEEVEEQEESEQTKDTSKEDEKKEEPEQPKEPEESSKLQLKTSKGAFEHDLSDKELTVRMLQQGYDAQQKWQEAAEIRNQSNQFMENLKADPKSILLHPSVMGDDAFTKMCEEHLMDRLEEEEMTPRERKLRAENRELRAAEHKKNLEAQQAKAADLKAAQERTMATIKETLETLGIPLSTDNINRTIQYMRQANDAGLTNVTPQAVIDYVRQDFIKEQQAYVHGLKPEDLLAFLGKDQVEALRKYYVGQVKAKAPVKQVKQPKTVEPRRQEASEPKFGDLGSFLNGY